MNNSKEWVALFEAQTGRKPSPQEFMAGKNSHFDLSQIPAIAGVEPVEDLPLVNPSLIPGLEEEKTLADHIAQRYEETNLAQESKDDVPIEIEPKNSVFPAAPVFSNMVQDEMVSDEDQASTQVQSKSNFALILGVSAAAVLLGLGGGVAFYMAQSTGPQATVKRFKQAVDAKNFQQVADILTNYKSKWTKEEAESFVGYLNSQDINLSDEFDKLSKSSGKTPFTDANGNKLLALEEDGKSFGIFSEYRMTTFPLKVKMSSNIENASVQVDQKKPVSLAPSSETEVGEFHFIEQEMTLKGKTSSGQVETSIKLDLKQAKNNELSMALNTSKKTIKATINAEIPMLGETKLKVNDKDVSTDLTKEMDLVPGQEIEVYVAFLSNGVSFNTDKKKVIIPDDSDQINLELSLSDKTKSKIKEIEEARKKAEEARAKAAEEARKKAEANKTKINSFLQNYRTAVFSSVRGKNNSYSQYYDTSSEDYKAMTDFTEGGGAAKAKIKYYSPGALDIKSIQEDNGNFIVQTYEDFTVYYEGTSKTSVNRRNKTYYLRPQGDSYVIYRLDATDI